MEDKNLPQIVLSNQHKYGEIMINDLSPRQIVKILESSTADLDKIRDFIQLLGYVSGHQTGNNLNSPKMLESFFDPAEFCGSFRNGFHAAMESTQDFQEVYYTVTITRDSVKDLETRYSERLVVDINEVQDLIILQIGQYLSKLWPSVQGFRYHVEEYHIIYSR